MKKKLVIGCAIAILALGIAYGTGAFYYKDKFFNGTSINGIDCGNLTAKEVEELIRKNVEGYSLELLFKEDRKEVIQGSEIAYDLMTVFFHEKVTWSTSLAILLAVSGVGLLYQGDGNDKLSTAGFALVMDELLK